MRAVEPVENRPSLLGPVGMGVFVTIVTILVATIIATILLFVGWDWAPYMHVVGMTVAFAGIALGAVFAGARMRSRGWLVGLLSGGIFVAICLLVCLLAGVQSISVPLTALRFGAACLTGAIGGILGVNIAG